MQVILTLPRLKRVGFFKSPETDFSDTVPYGRSQCAPTHSRSLALTMRFMATFFWFCAFFRTFQH